MRRHVDLLNAVLALRFKQPGYPRCLADRDYLVQLIGVTIELPGRGVIAPDVVASRLESDLTLLVEVKGGRDVDADQLGRMCLATPADLRDYAHLRVRDPGRHRVHVVYVCNEECREAFAHDVGTRGSVIGFDGERFRVSGAALPDAELAACLARAQVPADSAPIAIVPFDGESPDDEVARAVIPEIVRALVQGNGTITDDLVVSRTHHLVKSAMTSTGSGSELKDVMKRARTVLDDLATGELREWLERVRSKGPPSWRIIKALPAEGRTRELQKLQRAGVEYINRKGSGAGVQLSFEDVE